MKTIKKDKESKQDTNTETYLKKKKAKWENMEKTDIIICLRKETKTKRVSKNLPWDWKVSI